LHAAFSDNNRFDVQAGHKLDVVERKHVRRIDHGQGECGADAREGKHVMLLCDFLWDEAEHCGIDVEEFEIDGRNAVLPREHGSDHIVGDETQFDEIGGETPPVFTLVVECLSQVLRANQIFAYKNFA
jgi:hypothetical protein